MNKAIPIIALSVFVAIGTAAIYLRSHRDKPTSSPIPKPVAAKPKRAKVIDAAVPISVPAETKELLVANEVVRIKSTYQNFRTAIATGSEPLQEALLPVLLRDRKSALVCAEEELGRSKSEFDRTVAQKALEALRR